jgi:hypothetical protein
MSDKGNAMTMRPMRMLTNVLTVMIVVGAVWMPVVLGAASPAPKFYNARMTPVENTVDLCGIGLYVATIIVFCAWIHRAGANLVDAGLDGLEFKPASRIWWSFVPFANLVKPLHGMRELWNASHGTSPYDQGQSAVTTWWVLWLVNGALSNVALRTQLPNLVWTSAVVSIALAVSRSC